MENNRIQVARGTAPAGAQAGGPATERPAVEVLEFGVGYKLYRELWCKGCVRGVHMKIDVRDQANYTMRVLEVDSNDVLRIYKKWSYPWDWGTKVLLEARLAPQDAEKVRRYLSNVKSYRDFDEVAYWLLTARYVATRDGAVIDNELREPKL
jgi:hypothetical protein